MVSMKLETLYTISLTMLLIGSTTSQLTQRELSTAPTALRMMTPNVQTFLNQLNQLKGATLPFSDALLHQTSNIKLHQQYFQLN